MGTEERIDQYNIQQHRRYGKKENVLSVVEYFI